MTVIDAAASTVTARLHQALTHHNSVYIGLVAALVVGLDSAGGRGGKTDEKG